MPERDPKPEMLRKENPFSPTFSHEGCGSEWARGAPRHLLPPLPSPCPLPAPAPLTWPHRLHQDDAVPADGEAEAMLVLLDDDAALDQTWGGRGGKSGETPSLGGWAWLVGTPPTLLSVLGAAAPAGSLKPEPGAEPPESATPLPDLKGMANSSSPYEPLAWCPCLDPFS